MPKATLTVTLVVIVIFTSIETFGSSQLGYGSTKCSIFSAIEEEGGTIVESIESWTLGFLSGLNYAAATRGEPDQLRRQQPDRIAAYIRTFCATKADKTVAQAVRSFWTNSNIK